MRIKTFENILIKKNLTKFMVAGYVGVGKKTQTSFHVYKRTLHLQKRLNFKFVQSAFTIPNEVDNVLIYKISIGGKKS